MTGPAPATPASQPDGDDLTARVFRALYQAHDLHSVAGVHVAVPNGSPCFAGPSPGEAARQISDHEHPAPPAGPCAAAAPPATSRPAAGRRSRRPSRWPSLVRGHAFFFRTGPGACPRPASPHPTPRASPS